MSHRSHSGFSLTAVYLRGGQFFLMKWKPVMLAALSFALLSGIAGTFIDARIQTVTDAIALKADITQEQLNINVSERMNNFTEADAMLFIQSMRNAPTAPISESDVPVFSFLREVSPWVLMLVTVHVLILLLAATYFLTLANDALRAPQELAIRLPLTACSMIVLSFWLLVRSFLWIPIFGLVLALYMLPRLMLAPAIFAAKEAGIFGSLKESIRRTKKRWLQAFLFFVGSILIGLAILWFCIVIAAVIALFSTKIGLILWLFCLLTVLAFEMFLLSVFAATLA